MVLTSHNNIQIINISVYTHIDSVVIYRPHHSSMNPKGQKLFDSKHIILLIKYCTCSSARDISIGIWCSYKTFDEDRHNFQYLLRQATRIGTYCTSHSSKSNGINICLHLCTYMYVDNIKYLLRNSKRPC